MKRLFVAMTAAAIAAAAGLGLVMYALFDTPGPKQLADAFVLREPSNAVQPQTTGIEPREVRMAIPNPPANPEPKISLAQKKNNDLANRAARKKEHKLQREARKTKNRAREAFRSDNYQPQTASDSNSLR